MQTKIARWAEKKGVNSGMTKSCKDYKKKIKTNLLILLKQYLFRWIFLHWLGFFRSVLIFIFLVVFLGQSEFYSRKKQTRRTNKEKKYIKKIGYKTWTIHLQDKGTKMLWSTRKFVFLLYKKRCLHIFFFWGFRNVFFNLDFEGYFS